MREQETATICPHCFDVNGTPLTHAQLHAQLHAAQGELEQLRVQLAGCDVAACGGTQEPAQRGEYGWSPAYASVLRLREQYDAAQQVVEAMDSIATNGCCTPCQEAKHVAQRSLATYHQTVKEPSIPLADALQGLPHSPRCRGRRWMNPQRSLRAGAWAHGRAWCRRPRWQDWCYWVLGGAIVLGCLLCAGFLP